MYETKMYEIWVSLDGMYFLKRFTDKGEAFRALNILNRTAYALYNCSYNETGSIISKLGAALNAGEIRKVSKALADTDTTGKVVIQMCMGEGTKQCILTTIIGF
jgi:hypothetical protein